MNKPKKKLGPVSLSKKMMKVLKHLESDDFPTPNDVAAYQLWKWVRADDKNRAKFMDRVMHAVDDQGEKKKAFEKTELGMVLDRCIKAFSRKGKKT